MLSSGGCVLPLSTPPLDTFWLSPLYRRLRRDRLTRSPYFIGHPAHVFGMRVSDRKLHWTLVRHSQQMMSLGEDMFKYPPLIEAPVKHNQSGRHISTGVSTLLNSHRVSAQDTSHVSIKERAEGWQAFDRTNQARRTDAHTDT